MASIVHDIRSFVIGNSDDVNSPTESPSIVFQYIACKDPSKLAPTHSCYFTSQWSFLFLQHIKFSTLEGGDVCFVSSARSTLTGSLSLAKFHPSGFRLNVAFSKRLSLITLFKLAPSYLITPSHLLPSLHLYIKKKLFAIYLHSLEFKVHKLRKLNYLD